MIKKLITWMLVAALLLTAMPFPAFAATTTEIEAQIKATYQKALSRSGKSSFDGYCGDYVNWHLLVLGINKTNVAGHGKDQYDNYKDLTKSTGGYPITAYSAKNYTLKAALNKLTSNGTTDVYNILAGFQRTDSSPQYGHALFIHAIIDGIVYYSECYDCTINGKRYQEGGVIAITIDQMATYYGYWATFEGIIHFGTIYPSKMTLTNLEMPDILAQGTTPALNGTVKFHRTIDKLWVGIDEKGTTNHITQAQSEPKAYVCDLTKLLSGLNFKGLPTGAYTLKVRATGDGQEQQLYSQDFTVYPSKPTLTGLKMPVVMVEGTSPALKGQAAYYQTIDWLWVGVDTRGKQDHLIEAECDPGCRSCDITELLSELDFEDLPGGEYTLKVRATGGGREWQLYSQDFTVEASYMEAADVEFPDFMKPGEAPAIRGTIVSNHEITWVWAGVDSRDTGMTVTQAESEPNTYNYNLGKLAPELELAALEPGEYTYRVEGISGDDYYVLFEKDFTVFVPSEDRPFADVQEDTFFYEPVLWAVEDGITQGVSDITFAPAAGCNRAQVVTFLWRAEGSPEPAAYDHSFVDVPEGSFYEKAVLWAVENGITSGTDATHFDPAGFCNRAQAVTFLYRTFGAPNVEAAENPFGDVPDDTWYTVPVLWAVEQGITSGLNAECFGPNANCNRAQVVTFLYRAYID